MLSPTQSDACLCLREDFEPRRPDDLDAAHRAHLASCEECTAWTTRLCAAISAASPQSAPLPKALSGRLHALGRRPPDAYETQDPQVREHLDAFLSEAQRPLPPALALRLRKIARRKRRVQPMPLWLHDPRWVSAACVLFTLLSLPFLSGMETDVVRLATAGSYRSGEALHAVKVRVKNQSQKGLEKFREEQNQFQQQALVLWSEQSERLESWQWGSDDENQGEDDGRE